jgi:hypothetical protein
MSSQRITSRSAALAVLGLTESATEKEIKKAYHKAALLTHPDKPTGSEREFLEVQQAYTFLTDAPAPPTTTDAPAPPTTFVDLIAALFKDLNVDFSDAKVTVTTHQKAAPKCRFWNGTHGSCRNGDNCTFRHPTKLCKYYNHPGGCKFGPHCNFLHVKSK